MTKSNPTIYYFPLEPYKERYTVQLSAAKVGWLERRWLENDIDYVRIEGNPPEDNAINTGSVLDACKRGIWANQQVATFLQLFQAGKVNAPAVIYFDDFWHPGLSALPYAFQLTNHWVPMFAMLHAQSVDPFDFTYPMRDWMRYFEKGIGSVLDKIFVTSTCLKDLVYQGGIMPKDRIVLAGLPYNSDEVKSYFPMHLPPRKRQVIYTSRWDKEKCPLTFLETVDAVMQQTDSIKFIITTSAEKIRSNDPSLLAILQQYQKKYPNNLEVREGLTKEQYYHALLESKIQMNTANQDFVSWTLLEATTCGCRPLYPYWLSFPEVLKERTEFMYTKNSPKHAAEMILQHIDKPAIDYSWIYKPFDLSWYRMWKTMKGEHIYANEQLYC